MAVPHRVPGPVPVVAATVDCILAGLFIEGGGRAGVHGAAAAGNQRDTGDEGQGDLNRSLHRPYRSAKSLCVSAVAGAAEAVAGDSMRTQEEAGAMALAADDVLRRHHSSGAGVLVVKIEVVGIRLGIGDGRPAALAAIAAFLDGAVAGLFGKAGGGAGIDLGSGGDSHGGDDREGDLRRLHDSPREECTGSRTKGMRSFGQVGGYLLGGIILA